MLPASLILAGLVGAGDVIARAQAPAPIQAPVPEGWAGTWRGKLTDVPARAGAVQVDVTREIGDLPRTDNSCTTWRTSYSERGKAAQVKDYRLCRGTGPDDWFVDEGNGIKLTARWMGDVLVSPFKYDELLLVSSARLRGDVLEEEIVVIDDKPAIKGVLSLRPRSIQRLELKRVPPRP